MISKNKMIEDQYKTSVLKKIRKNMDEVAILEREKSNLLIRAISAEEDNDSLHKDIKEIRERIGKVTSETFRERDKTKRC